MIQLFHVTVTSPSDVKSMTCLTEIIAKCDSLTLVLQELANQQTKQQHWCIVTTKLDLTFTAIHSVVIHSQHLSVRANEYFFIHFNSQCNWWCDQISTYSCTKRVLGRVLYTMFEFVLNNYSTSCIVLFLQMVDFDIASSVLIVVLPLNTNHYVMWGIRLDDNEIQLLHYI